jgi:uncharacterized protein YndB with AHSA1/START domain
VEHEPGGRLPRLRPGGPGVRRAAQALLHLAQLSAEIASLFGWSDEQVAELRKEPISRVAFEIEPATETSVKLTVVHDGFAPDSEMLKGISQGWPAILSNLKTLLETGETL